MALTIGNEVDINVISNKKTYGNVSNRYINTSTEELMAEFSKYMDIKPIGFSKARVRKQEKQNKQRHVLMLEPNDAELLDGTRLRLVLYNSSDRSTSIRIYLGAYREACANGLVFGEDLMDPIHIKHTYRNWRDVVKQTAESYQSAKFNTEQTINRMMNKYMTYDQQGQYASSIAAIINKDITGRIIDPMELNIAHRTEDTGQDIWHTYQRIQYNVMNGGIQRAIKLKDEITISNTHKVTDQHKQLKYNLAVYAEAKKQLLNESNY